MKKFIPKTCLVLTLALAFSAVAYSQTVPDDVVKITTKLVQVDVVVRDKKGNQVPQLGVGDFELLQDGKPQKIVGLTYVPVKTAGTLATNASEKSGEPKTPTPSLPPVRAVPTATSRIIAFLVDDGACGASVWGLDSAKTAVTRFIRDQMLPDDLVAIYRTRAGSSSFQQYTSDKATLLKAADKIRWYPPQGACASSDGSFNEAIRDNTYGKLTNDGVQTVTIESEAEKKIREYREDSVSDSQIVGTLGVFRYAVNGLQRAAGRKMMFVLSDGITLRSRSNERQQAADRIRELTDAANRAGVVVHSLYLRGGNIPGMIESKDEVYTGGGDFEITERISQSRIDANNRNQEGMAVLAHDTGGGFTAAPRSQTRR